MKRSPISRALRVAPALVTALLLAGCAGDLAERIHMGTVYPDTMALMAQDDMDRSAPIMIRIFKEDSTLEVWKQDRGGRYALLKSYPICHFSGGLGPKRAAGDHQAPEGFYSIGPGQMNPHSREYLSFNVGYPNAYDRALGRTGDSLMVHGGCRSVGCYAMTDKLIDEIFALAHEAHEGGQREIQLEAFPFRMTAANIVKHADDPNAPFWAMLKVGSDLFEHTRQPPQVSVVGQAYVFSPGGLDASASVGAL